MVTYAIKIHDFERIHSNIFIHAENTGNGAFHFTLAVEIGICRLALHADTCR